MHFATVLEHLDSFCYRWLVLHNRPGLFKVPAVPETVAAQMAFSGRLLKRFGALAAEWFLQQADILQTCSTIGNFRTPLQTLATAQTGQWEKGLLCCLQKLFYSKPDDSYPILPIMASAKAEHFSSVAFSMSRARS